MGGDGDGGGRESGEVKGEGKESGARGGGREIGKCGWGGWIKKWKESSRNREGKKQKRK